MIDYPFRAKLPKFVDPILKLYKPLGLTPNKNFVMRKNIPSLKWIRVFKMLKNTHSKSNARGKFQKSVKFITKEPFQSHPF